MYIHIQSPHLVLSVNLRLHNINLCGNEVLRSDIEHDVSLR